MRGERECYKVCKVIGGRYYSLYSYHGGSREYELGKWTSPKRGCGPMVVMTILEAAIRWRNTALPHYLLDCVILKALYIPAKKKCLWAQREIARGLIYDGDHAAFVKLIEEEDKET